LADPGDGSSSNPRTLKASEDGVYSPEPARPYLDPLSQEKTTLPPTSKDEATAVASSAKDNFDAWKAANLGANVPIKISDGEIYRWEEPEPAVRPANIPEEDWALLQAGQSAPSGKWVLDIEGQSLYDYWQNSLSDAKEFKASGGAASAYVDAEPNKTKEITRQYHDFEDRASLLYDLMGDEQDYAMAADDQNIANWKAQRDLGMATSPGGYYTTPYQSMTMSEILRPSLPDYVRPDYRLNESVGLPGPQGFDDPDYSPYGLPMFANGTAPLPPNFWPWPPRR